MSGPIIICDRLGKSYRLGAKQQNGNWFSASLTLRETLSNSFRSALPMLRKTTPQNTQASTLFWALRDVSFEVERGEVIAIIGRNGAGKSTLLKILSRIVEPTEGVARLRGRVASLLEVGTGFHLELTGRENIYLNGSILGMRKSEINRKFEEIVAFSEIEEFLDTPVKRYSSGMYVRLAFAVAAHLEPEILIVDEVLAVGDHAFQKKCLGKMHDVATSDGRTILFVSHNMSALSQLCERGIYLEEGRVSAIGPVKDVIQTYLRSNLDRNTAQASFPLDLNRPCQYMTAEILHEDGSLGSEFSCDEPVIIRLQFEIREVIPNLFLTFFLQNLEGTRVIFSDVRDTDPAIQERLTVGMHTFEIEVPPRLLAPATYVLSIGSNIRFSGVADQQEACCEFTLRDMATTRVAAGRSAVVGTLLPWEHRQTSRTGAAVPSDSLHSA